MTANGSFEGMADKHRRFEALVGALMPDLYRYAYWLCREKALAEDLVQETMLRAWRSLDSLRDEGSAKRWLITILRRERARYYERLRPDTVDIENVPLADERQLDAEDNAERDHIRRTMQMLDEDYREPLVLQVLMGYSVEEIADIMGLNKATVLTRLFRARKKLAGLLEDPVLQAEGI